MKRFGIYLLLLVLAAFVGHSARAQSLTVIDMTGRQVALTQRPRRIVALGPGALRLLVYLQATDRLVGIEDLEKRRPGGRPYIMAHPELARLPSIGPGGPSAAVNKPDLEAILEARPEVVFASFLEPASADVLQQTLGIPVVALRYARTATSDDAVIDSIRLAAEVLGSDERARQVERYVRSIQEDLRRRTSDLAPGQRASAYVGGVGYRGVHGIESTERHYIPMLWSGVDNAVERVQSKLGSHLFMDKEMLLALDPDTIFLDGGGLGLVLEDYRKHAAFYRTLSAFRERRIFLLFPFNAYATNIETALADAYAVGKILYPDRFADVDLEKKADEIYRFFVGRNLYRAMAKAYTPLGSTAPFWQEPRTSAGE